MNSPYINRFLQPDTLIPGVDSPQSWNRYSYVQNNPIRFSDPTGHYCVGDDEDCIDGEGGTGPTPIIPPATSPGNACSGPNPSMLCIPQEEELNVLDLPFNPNIQGQITQPEIPDLHEFDEWAWFTQKSLEYLDYASSYEDIILSYKPIYKQVKYAFGTGGLEAVIDSTIYGLKDRWSTSLSPGQRLGRMVAVGGQSYIVDRLSNKVGVVGIPFGGKAGEVAVQYLFSGAVSEFILPTTTNWIFGTFNLGVPIDVSPIR